MAFVDCVRIVHLLRDLHALKEAHPHAPDAQAWATTLRALYDHGQRCTRQELRPVQQERTYRQLECSARALACCYADSDGHPCQTLALRWRRHRGELFEFVRVPTLDATNNEAELRLRPVVIARTISGGSRSALSTQARLDLASLFQTWHAQGRNSFAACYTLLHSALPQV